MCWWGVGTLSVRLLATAAMSVLSLSWLTASNCGKGLPKVLQQLRKGFRRSFGFRCLARWLTAARVPVLGSVAARPAVPARRLPFRLVVLCKGCPCCPVGVPGSVPHLLGVSFLVRVAPFPIFSRFFLSSFLLPLLNSLLLYYYSIS